MLNVFSSFFCSGMELNIIFFCHSYAIGGLSGGEDKNSFWRVVAQCTAALPEDKPRYVMVRMTFMITSYNRFFYKIFQCDNDIMTFACTSFRELVIHLTLLFVVLWVLTCMTVFILLVQHALALLSFLRW